MCCAFMAEVHANMRVFLQPNPIITFLERVASNIPEVAIHPSEHGSSHVPWTFVHAISPMGCATEISASVVDGLHHGSSGPLPRL